MGECTSPAKECPHYDSSMGFCRRKIEDGFPPILEGHLVANGSAAAYNGALANSLQQLKVEIRAIQNIIEITESGIVTVDFAMLKQRLRELSTI